MDPIGRFLQAVVSLGKRTTDLRPGMQLRAVVVQHRGGDFFLLQVGSQRVTAQSHLPLQPGQSLSVKVEQGAEGLIFRVLDDSGANSAGDRLARVMAAQVGTEVTTELRSLLDSFIQIGIPLSEAYTAPAFRQLSRLLRDFPALQGRLREVSRLVAMFSDRGMQVPDDIVIGVLAYGDESPSRKHFRQNHSRQKENDVSPPEADPETDPEPGPNSENALNDPDLQYRLQLPDSASAVDPGLVMLASIRHREPPWLVIPFRFRHGSHETELQGTLRLQMNDSTVSRTVLDVPLPDDRWVFSWIPDSDHPMQVFTRRGSMPESAASALRLALQGSGIVPPDTVEDVQRWDGFCPAEASAQAAPGLLVEDSHG